MRIQWVTLTIFLPACTGIRAMRQTPLAPGQLRVYPDDFAVLAAAAPTAAHVAGLAVDTLVRPDSGTEVIIAHDGAALFKGRQIVRVFVERRPDGKTNVRVFARHGTIGSSPLSDTSLRDREDKVFEALGGVLARRANKASGTARDSLRHTLRRWAIVTLSPRATVRVGAAGARLGPGKATVINDSTLAIGLDQTQPRFVPIESIDSLWERRSHWRLGGAVGSVVGLAAGLLIVKHQHPMQCGWNDMGTCAVMNELGAEFVVGLSSLAGTLLGSGLGSAVAHWKLRFP